MSEAKIKQANYGIIARQAKDMRKKGQTLNINFTNIHSELDTTLKNGWSGKRYNKLAQIFNKIVPTLNTALNVIVDEIPYNLQLVANNYSQADADYNCTTATHEAPRKIKELGKTDENDNIKLLSAQVRASEKKVSRNIEDAIVKLNEIVKLFDGIAWQSEARERFKENLHKYQNDIKKTFEEIQTIISTYMTKAATKADAAESANTIKG